MNKENNIILIWCTIITIGLIFIIVLSKINIALANMYPEVSSIILGVHGIGIVIGILMCTIGGLLGLLITKVIERFDIDKKGRGDEREPNKG